VTARIDRLWPDPADYLSDDDLAAPLGPCVRMNFVASVDGAATRHGRSGGLSSAGDKRYFEVLRRVCDVVLVGAGTVRTEGYGPMHVSEASAKWRVAQAMPQHPVFAIVSGGLDLDPASAIFTDAPVMPLLVTTAAASGMEKFAGIADILVAGDGPRIDSTVMIAGLRERGLTRILCEGGPTLFGSLLEADAVDELSLTVAPSLEGGDATRIATAPTPPRNLALAQVLKSGDSLLLRYTRARSVG